MRVEWKSAAWLFAVALAAPLLVAGFIWIGRPVTDQELLANFSKAENFFRGILDQGGFAWWSPVYLQGTSLAFAWVFMATNAILLAFSIPFGFLAGPKIATVFLLWIGGVGSFCFLRRYSGNPVCGWIGSALFVLSPSVLTRAAGFEHFAVLLPMALFPWLLWTVLCFVQSPCFRSAAALGVVFSFLLLSYTKAGLMVFLMGTVFGALEFFSVPRDRRPGWGMVALAAGVVFLLAVVPNLPALRESGFVAMFEFGPFEGWQRAFSTKSALSWFDRDGFLGAGMDAGFAPTTLNGGTYLGFVLAAVLVALLLRAGARGSAEGRCARTMLALGLGMFWLSFGPRSVVGGHFEFLRMSPGAADFTPALAWILLVAQVWVVFKLVPQGSVFWRWVAAGVSLVYLFVPGFRLLEWVPLYSNIRAPFDFYQVAGAVCMASAAALAAGALLAGVHGCWRRRGLAAVLVVFAAVDGGVYARPFFQSGMDRAVWTDFLAAQEFLKSAPAEGRVYPFSGRYFYLVTPWISGRPLAAEAFNSYLQQRGAAVLQGSAFFEDGLLRTYMRVAGVAYLLVDKTDPDTDQALQERLRGIFPVAFENANMAVLAVGEPLGFGFLAKDFVQAGGDGPEVAMAALGGAEHKLAVVGMDGAAADEPGMRGRVVDGRIAPPDGGKLEEGAAFEPVGRVSENYQRVEFAPAGGAGWLVSNEAWHPDWRAFQGGRELEIHKAMLAFSAVRTDGTGGVVFEFREPWWYNFCAWAAVGGWVAALGFLAVVRGCGSVNFQA